MYEAIVEPLSDESGICASCSFTNDSTARGCTVELLNDEFTFVFNMSRQSSEDPECFPVLEAGVFNVSVYEVQHDGTVGHKVFRLPNVTIQSDIDKTTQSVSDGMITIILFSYIDKNNCTIKNRMLLRGIPRNVLVWFPRSVTMGC